MSLESWNKLYYPVEASKVSKQDALAHSLRKWRGLLHLNEHGLIRIGNVIMERGGTNSLQFNGETCALCHHHVERWLFPACSSCPLVLASGEQCNENNTPWDCFRKHGPFEPMIKALEKAQRWERKHRRKP